MEIFNLRPFLFPPIPRTGVLLRKGPAKKKEEEAAAPGEADREVHGPLSPAGEG